MTDRRRITRGFEISEEGEGGTPPPRKIRTREQIMKGEGKRPPASVKLTVLAHNPFNPREELTDVEETAESLRVRGQLQPVAVVRRAAFLSVHPDQEKAIGAVEYVVIDGNRRLAAAALAGLPELRIDVNDDLATSAADMLESALIANIHRVDVPPLDQARAIQELLAKHGSQEEVARRLGKSGAWVSQRLALLSLQGDLQDKVASGELTVKDGRRIGRLPAEKQRTEADAALNRVKAPRKPRTRIAPQEAVEAAPSSGTGPATSVEVADVSVPTQTSGTDRAGGSKASGLNPVNGATVDEAVPDLPWDNPAWFDRMLRLYMAPEQREALAWLLQADR
ncbi:ParB/RepB/Spo0J family partition protein [Streptomyces sp. NPDC088197]|uniref:ParB/RepB/Spo0J family partition protein n=1 Tax=unclassified Streptomyces TaxID=2593676 RepID=UPI0036EA3BA9